MQYRQFEIENYRGIERTIIKVPDSDGTRVTTLIGLNESGKTTILEALYSFSPDPESTALYGDSVLLSDDPAYFIPRREFSNFNGDIIVRATVDWDDGEKQEAARTIKRRFGIELDLTSIRDQFTITSKRTYKNSAFQDRSNIWSFPIEVRSGQQKLFRTANAEQKRAVFTVLLGRLPKIAYFPTFVFDFPERIYLKGGEDRPVDRFYKKIFQAILDAGGSGHNISEHIVKRFEDQHDKTFLKKFMDLAATMAGISSSNEMIKQTVDKAADTVSDVIIARWDEIFRHSPLRKQILIEPFEHYEEDGEGEEKTINHDVWVEFKVKDSGSRYNISDRSLGFRWFFCFLLFTRFMSEMRDEQKLVFLFDEPASNLHAKAQEKLLESFSEIGTFPNCLIFSTHSHYMIEPLWLDRAYVVKNDAIDYSDASGEQKKGGRVKIEAIPYADFVGQGDGTLDRTTYFQPVLDRLEVKPSKVDIQSRCVVVEGKSDFHILEYVKRRYLTSTPPLVPATGASTMRPVIALLRGWGDKFLVLLDGDADGDEAAQKYRSELDLDHEVITIPDLDKAATEIEDFLSQDDLAKLQAYLNLQKKPSKKQIRNAFVEANASNQKLPITGPTIKRLKHVLKELDERLNSSGGASKPKKTN